MNALPGKLCWATFEGGASWEMRNEGRATERPYVVYRDHAEHSRHATPAEAHGAMPAYQPSAEYGLNW